MCDVQLPHATVSAEHALIVFEGDRYYLVDPGSANGTYLAGEPLIVARRKLLRSGDVIGVAGFEILFQAGVAMVSFHCQNRTVAVARQLAQQFLAHEGQAVEPPALVVLNGPQEGERFELSTSPATWTLGRSDESDIQLFDREASRRQARLRVTAEGVFIDDEGGKNPLLVNNRPVTSHRLRDRDEVSIGATQLVFDDSLEAYLRELQQLADVQPLAAAPTAPGEQAPAPPAIEDPGREPVAPLPPQRPSTEGGNGSAPGPVGAAPAAHQPQPFVAPESGEDRQVSPTIETPGRDQADPPAESPVPSLLNKSSSAQTETAILLVGIVALIACIAALLWIFH
jgi:pSer/pThr/pTyr-binding forkhead associated (FHA) protein